MKRKTGKLIRRIRRFYSDFDSLEKKLFWTVVPLVAVTGIISVIGTWLEQLGTLALLSGIITTVTPLVMMIVFRKTEKYDLSFAIFSLVMTCVMLPLTYLSNGGLHSGMPLYCLAGSVLCTICTSGKYRWRIFIISILVNMSVFGLSISHPEIVIPIREDFIESDIMISYLVMSVCLMAIVSVVINEFREYTNTKAVLDRYMDRSVRAKLMLRQRSGAEVGPTGELCKTVVLFTDVCNFTSISETMDPKTVAEFLNTFLSVADECIHRNDGILDKYIGDSAMAFWVVDERKPEEAVLSACRAALEINERLGEICEDVFTRFGCDLLCSMGINYGDAIIGDIGSEKRMDYTVIGDAVNMASRLQNAAPGGTIYASQSIATMVGDTITLDRVPKKVVLKGKSAPVDIYTVVSMDSPKSTGEIFKEISKTGYILHVCGSRGSYALSGARFARFGGETSCYIFKKGKYALIVDCGTGLQRARSILADCEKIDVILTHVHYDHIIGLLDWSLFPPNVPLKFYGNFDKWLGQETVSQLFRAPFWPIDSSCGEMISVETGIPYSFGDDIKVEFYKASHPNEANLLYLDVGGKRICLMADCENPEDIPADRLSGCDMLIFDGMYEDKYYHEHIGWGHSTWERGVDLAITNKVGQLVITHHNPRNSDEKLQGLEMRAKELFPPTTFAKAGDRFVL